MTPDAVSTPPAVAASLGSLQEAVAQRVQQFRRDRVVGRIWSKDPTVWGGDETTPELADRLGWLDLPTRMQDTLDPVDALAASAKGRYSSIVLCGMGGSSLAPAVMASLRGPGQGYPNLTMLDSTVPEAVRAATPVDFGETLFVISSKSGTTLETECFARRFWDLAGRRGDRFCVITDPGTPLENRAREEAYHAVFLSDPEVGGRFSALAPFGLVPAALVGVDIRAVLADAATEMENARGEGPENPAAWLGAVIGEAALSGRDKLTLVLSPRMAALGLWIEQLVAESTGKRGKGVLPVVRTRPPEPGDCGADRVIVGVTLADEPPAWDAALDGLAAAGHPVVRWTLPRVEAIGAEFYRWEFATAVAGSILGVNPFDQPDVAESKRNTVDVLEGRKAMPAEGRAAGDAEPFLAAMRPGSYLAILAYVPPSAETDEELQKLAARLETRFRVVVTVGYGPRYLHSTGQLHKGGPPNGHFVQWVAPMPADEWIPGERHGFADLVRAQAEGDYLALRARGLPVLRQGTVTSVSQLAKTLRV